MIFLALKMLTGDRTKYAGLLFGVTFTSFLVTFAAAYFGGMMNRSYALVAETPGDVWVMDPAVVSVEPAIPLPDSALNRVRSVAGVRSAVPLIVSSAEARFSDGTFQSLEVIGVDDESLAGLPRMPAGLKAESLRGPDAALIDSGGTDGKTDLTRPARPLGRGDVLSINDNRAILAGRSDALPRYPPRPLLYTTLPNARRILPVEREEITFVLANVAPGADPKDVAARIEQATGLRARPREDFEQDTVRWMIQNSEDVGDVINMLSIAMLVGVAVTGVMMFMFTNENLRFYAVLKAMGTTTWQLVVAVVAQAAVAAAIGAGLGMGLCALAGHFFVVNDFPYRLEWFAPALGTVAVVVISMLAAAASLWPLLRMRPAPYLAGR
ncbi:MAG TPA: ABC transporter permease [Candidatus Didemnitutus sp.]|nr:ABC transporter permease [Candidatus Didemnitutus sp.]